MKPSIKKRFLLVGWILCCFSTFTYAQTLSDSTIEVVIVQDTIEMLVPQIEFEQEEFELGEVMQGTKIRKTFRFINSGTDTLTLFSAVADCSCTVPSFNEGDYAPGESGEIEVEFDSTDNLGQFIQYVTLIHNAGEGYSFLILSGFVMTKL